MEITVYFRETDTGITDPSTLTWEIISVDGGTDNSSVVLADPDLRWFHLGNGTYCLTAPNYNYSHVKVHAYDAGDPEISYEGFYQWPPMGANETYTGLASKGVTTLVNPVLVVLTGASPTTKRIQVFGIIGGAYAARVTRQVDGYVLDWATEDFSAAPATPVTGMAEVSDGRFTLETLAVAWDDGAYSIEIQDAASGGSAVVGAATVTISSDNVSSGVDVAAMIAGGIATESAPGAIETAITNTSSSWATIAADLETLLDQIEAALDNGVAYVQPDGPAAVGSKLVSTLFDDVRVMLRDKGGNQYKSDIMCAFFNRAAEEINSVLMQIGAEIAMGRATIVGDGVNQDHQLPVDFRAFVPNTIRPRSPIDATASYTHGPPLEHIDQLTSRIEDEATTVSDPTCFTLTHDADYQYIRFNCIPRLDNRYDFLYYRIPATVSEENISITYMPWKGLLDPLFARTLEQYCREGLEFTADARAVWRARAEADAMMLLGLRHLQTQTINPSVWRGLPR